MTHNRVKVAMILADEREVSRRYCAPEPSFGTAPSAVVEGLASLPECEIHLLCCLQQPVRSPSQLAHNIHFHALTVPKIGWLRSGYLGCISAVRARLRAIEPDVVHGQGTERHYAICAAFSGFPHVVTIHGNMRRIAKLERER